MKLLLCAMCQDVIGLQRYPHTRWCQCGLSSGHYASDSNVRVEVEGPCRVIGLPNGIRYGQADRVEVFLIAEPGEAIVRKEGL